MDWGGLTTVLDFADRALAKVLTSDARTQARWTAAVAKLQVAVLDTELYASGLDRGQPVDRAVEERLVGLWRSAATDFYPLNGELAERLQLKAEYWTQPEAWTSQQVRDAGIALEHVAELTRQILHEGR